ncbi:MAG: hypothetical protein AAF692_02090 [Pseudomonadota bacterium]
MPKFAPVLAPLCLGLASLALSGCIARTAAKIVTAPVDLASGAVDKATTSQSEADEKRGRELRKREEKLGKLEREYRKERERCDEGNRKACERAAELSEEIQALIPTIPGEGEAR